MCETNCERCADKNECTHCAVTPARYYLEQGSCQSSITSGHYAEFYDDFYTKLNSCFFDKYLSTITCDECKDGSETSCTKCKSGLLMIQNKEGTDVGRCVAQCPFYYYKFGNYCVKDCPAGMGEDKENGVCFLCSTEISNCDDCERNVGEFATCKKCSQGYLPDENYESCLDHTDALALSAVVDSYGIYRYCDRDCKDCQLVDDNPVCMNCNDKDNPPLTTTALYLFEDGSCIANNACEWDEVNF